ncbi:MAG: hypothetical protein NCW75_00270 [Phycisphaera sp.]|nr:MAG: hypothetical protein NCW75_00270 [Phycisphaera sp.]
MSSLLDGIDVADNSSSSSSSGGPNPKVIKGAIAGVLFLLAAVVLAMNFGIIPAPWGGDSVTNKQGESVEYVPPSDAEVKEHTERLKQEEEEFIRRGGTIGGS